MMYKFTRISVAFLLTFLLAAPAPAQDKAQQDKAQKEKDQKGFKNVFAEYALKLNAEQGPETAPPA